MQKILRIGTLESSGGKSMSVYIKIEYEDKRLSISGVIGPLKSGNALGGCGQIDMEFAHRNPAHNDSRYKILIQPDEFKFAPGWNKDQWLALLEVWKTYHLNDLQAGCEHQRAFGWGDILLEDSKPKTYNNMAHWTYPTTHPRGVLTKPCPICGYRYGSEWRHEEIPQDVIEWLFNLPDTDQTPAWV